MRVVCEAGEAGGGAPRRRLVADDASLTREVSRPDHVGFAGEMLYALRRAFFTVSRSNNGARKRPV